MAVNGETGILRLETTGFVIRSFKGEVGRTFGVPFATEFRYPLGGRLPDGRWVFLASGGGYVPYYMIAVFSAEGELEYHEISPGRAYSMIVPDEGPETFLVAGGESLWRYTIPATTSEADKK